MNWLKALAVTVIAFSLGACATVSSRYGNDKVDQRGQAYYLPKGLIKVSVYEIGGAFDVVIGGPIMVADSDYRFHADLRKAAFSENDIVVEVDPSSMLLQSASVTSRGKVGEILEKVVRAASYTGRGTIERPVEIYSGLYDVDQMDLAGKEASAALNNYLLRFCGPDSRVKGPYSQDECATFERQGLTDPGVISIANEVRPFASTANKDVGKCRRGLCYRPLVPVKIRSVVLGTYIQEDFFLVPDLSTVSYYTLPAGAFATQEYDLSFEDGVLKKADQKTESEVLGLVSLPVDVLQAIVDVPYNAIRGSDDGDGDGAAPAGQYGQGYQAQRTYAPVGESSHYKLIQFRLGTPRASQQGYSISNEPRRFELVPPPPPVPQQQQPQTYPARPGQRPQ